ncbi:bifunctional phosphopantothenoylcysteine decarboxylase/phosphopantothenate--cysteine ligase CoaBC [Pelagibacterales bacterium SAG-MED12]|nr:bifunctional phosphopantothenoylcysteine decarboxylase/phosphopantothenate--cysteine ligase CoaBC [Pelagibacterales bacterium SAG-MED12]
MKDLTTKKILFVICGGVSAYKSLETIRLFKKNNAEIKTILTKSAKEFVTPLSIASLSQGKVYDDLFNVENETEMDHIALSRWADVIVVAPATANTLSKLSQGSSEDLASTVILASNKQVFLAPAMNVRMWEHPSTKDNFKILKSFGYKFIGPVTGDMACGEYGEGKMSDPYDIFNEIYSFLFSQLKNKKIKALVTAGPTNEYIDPVRFITNKSSGKQGYEIAKSLSRRGFNTTLISGPTNLTMDEDIKLIKVETAEEMFKATQINLPTDIAVFSAAVADYKINKKSQNKIKKQEKLNINLEQNIDILNYVSNHNSMRPKLVIGFAAETSNLDKNAISKLKNKNCDWIVANDVSKKNIGFESDYNEVTIHYKNTPNKKEKLSLKKKSEISEEIVDRIVNQIN